MIKERMLSNEPLTMNIRFLAILTFATAPSVAVALAQQPTQNPVQPQLIKIPMKGGGVFGSDVEMVTHFYKAQSDGSFPVVIFSHGRAGERDKRWNLKSPVLVGHGNFWLRKGFALVAPVRPGYGDTGGVDREASGTTGLGSSCRGTPDFVHVAKTAGQAVLATLDWVRAQPWARTDKVLLVGQSVGGLATVAVGAMNPPGVLGAINFSGGAGGSPDTSPGHSCRPEKLTEAFHEFGKTIKIPSLWLYAENDLYWGADAPKEWHKAFSAAGSKTRFVMTEPVPGTPDGHRLLAAGGRLWSPHVNEFVKELGF
jgi:dienelactone hydrolase